MKLYITKYSGKILDSKIAQPIYVHYRENCKKLQAVYKTDTQSIPNSGIQEINFDGKEKLFSMLKLLGKFKVCMECEYSEMVESYEHIYFNISNEESFLKEAIAEYDRLNQS